MNSKKTDFTLRISSMKTKEGVGAQLTKFWQKQKQNVP